MFVGIGTDVHRIVEGRELWLAALHFPEESWGLEGHSDGDVVSHAACDALFSAAGLGDMGSNFGTSEPEWSGASGKAFLVETARRVREAGFEIVNVAVQLIGPKPRFSHRRAEAEEVIGRALGARVTLSATTTDGLGFTGRGEGLAAVAVASVQPAG